jgi:hypothetical protein
VIAQLVYLLCGATSLACAVLLLRAYRQSGFRLLLWSGICFSALTLNNTLLFVDLIVVPDIDLSLWRNLTAFIGVGTLLVSLIWETR